jgi:hypothetical protein
MLNIGSPRPIAKNQDQSECMQDRNHQVADDHRVFQRAHREWRGDLVYHLYDLRLKTDPI